MLYYHKFWLAIFYIRYFQYFGKKTFRICVFRDNDIHSLKITIFHDFIKKIINIKWQKFFKFLNLAKNAIWYFNWVCLAKINVLFFLFQNIDSDAPRAHWGTHTWKMWRILANFNFTLIEIFDTRRILIRIYLISFEKSQFWFFLRNKNHSFK